MIKPNQSISAGGKTYSPREVRALLQKLASLGINRDKIIAQINPEEAALLKRLGGSGKINPRTGLLSFDDDGGGNDGGGGDDGGDDGNDGGDPSGGGGGGGGGNGDSDGYGGGYGDFDAAAFADAVAANNEAMSNSINDAMSYSADGDAPAPGAVQTGLLSDLYSSFFGRSDIPATAPGIYNGQNLIATPSAPTLWGDQAPAPDPIDPAIIQGELLDPINVSAPAPDPAAPALAPEQYGPATLNEQYGGQIAAAMANIAALTAERDALLNDPAYSAMITADQQAAATQARAEATLAQTPEEARAAYDAREAASQAAREASDAARQAAAERGLDQFLADQAARDAALGINPTSPGLDPIGNASLYPSVNNPDQYSGPFTLGGPGSGGFGLAGTNVGSPYGGTVSETYPSFGLTAAGPYSSDQWGWGLAPASQPFSTDPVAAPSPQTAPNPVDWSAFQQQYNADQFTPNFATNLPAEASQLVFDPALPQTMTAPTPTLQEGLSPVAAAPSLNPNDFLNLFNGTLPNLGFDFSNLFTGTQPDRDLEGSSDYYDSGGTEPGWVEPTGLVPTVEATQPLELMDREPTRNTGKPPLTDTPVQNPILPTQFIDWLHYAERNNPEFGFYQTNRTPTPYAAHGGYFDADAYFADGGLVSAQGAPVQPMVASMPTMAYTDGQGLVGAIAAPPGLTPYDSYGSDAPHASPMAPAPAAAAPSFSGPLQTLGTRNTNAAPVPAPISQNPNLGYSLGLSGLRG